MESSGAKFTARRSTGSLPTVWDCQLLKSFTTPYSLESHGPRLQELKKGARELLGSVKDAGPQLDLIHTMQRLGVAYLFQKEIHHILAMLIHQNIPSDLYTVALHFRILRQNGFFVTTDEHVLDEARNFSAKHLLVLKEKVETRIGEHIRQSMEYPQHWRMEWTEARDFIGIYQKQTDDAKNWGLLELAKLNYNILQSIYLKELQELVDSPQGPQYAKCRRNITKFGSLATPLDDIYDTYGTLAELDKFTDAIKRWDLKVMEELPEYMKFLYEAIYNHVSETAQDALVDNGIDILPYIKELWQDYIGTYLKEARWLHNGYNPSAQEYLENAWVSVGIVTPLVYGIFGVAGRSIHQYLSEFVENWSCSDLVCMPAYFIRFIDDLKTSEKEMERGESMNFVHFYMIEKGVSKEEACDHVKGLIRNLWRRMNKAIIQDSARAPAIVKVGVNMIRSVYRMYKYGDFFGIQTKQNQECVKSILEPIPMD
ncbi:hypothetical protein V6N13_118011 [Hibiscus sabdariffa]